jgi:hypothetical protein
MGFAPARLSMKACVAGSSGPASARVLEGADMGTSYCCYRSGYVS